MSCTNATKKTCPRISDVGSCCFCGGLRVWVNLRSSPTYSKKLQNRREPREATVAPRHSDLVDGLARVLSAFPLPNSVHHEMVARSQRLEQTDVVDL